MTRMRSVLSRITCLMVLLLVWGCASYRATPVDPRSVGTLTPTIEDRDVGLVGMAPRFSLQQYQALIIEPFVVAPAEIKDADDSQLAKDMSTYLQAQLVANLRADPTLPKVVDATAAFDLPTGPGVLALRGDISRLTEGSQALRYLVGFGAGSAKAQVETRLVAIQSQEVQMIEVKESVAAGVNTAVIGCVPVAG